MFKESTENALYKRQVFKVVTKIGSGVGAFVNYEKIPY